MSSTPSRVWQFSVMTPRRSGERSVRIARYIVCAPMMEHAQRRLALDLGEYGIDHVISPGQEIDYSEPLHIDSGSYTRATGEEFRGRVVRSILAEIALDAHRMRNAAATEEA